MMRFLFLTMLVLLTAALFTSFALSEPGYVLLGYGKTSIEMPLVDFVIFLLGALLLLFLLVKAMAAVFSTPTKLRGMRQRQQRNQARKGLTKGLIDMAAGEWAQAEKTVIKGARRSDVPLLNYLVAAHAAQQQDETQRRDEHIRKAIEADPQAEVAVGLTQAELQIRQKQYEEALATLQHLERLAPKHKFVKKQLARLFFKLKDWQHLAEILPTLRKQGGMKSDELGAMEVATVNARMEYAASQDNWDDLQRLWKAVPKDARLRPELIAIYTERLLDLGKNTEAEVELRTALNAAMDDRLLTMYAGMEFAEPSKALAHAEGWLAVTEQNPTLLTTVAKLSLKARLWGKARSLLQQSIALKPSVENHRALAELHESVNEQEEALVAYKTALALSVGNKA